jgi:phosphoserine phosphatase
MIELFRHRRIATCVISGCPAVLLNHYISRIGVGLAHGLRVERDRHAVYTGRIEVNPALAEFKEHLAGELDSRYRIVVGLGNTPSDLPLVGRAECGLIVGGRHRDFDTAVRAKLKFVEPDEVLAALQECLDG